MSYALSIYQKAVFTSESMKKRHAIYTRNDVFKEMEIRPHPNKSQVLEVIGLFSDSEIGIGAASIPVGKIRFLGNDLCFCNDNPFGQRQALGKLLNMNDHKDRLVWEEYFAGNYHLIFKQIIITH